MKVIEGKFRVLAEGDSAPLKPRRRLHPAVRYILTRPSFVLGALVIVSMLTLVGLTEGLW